MVGILAAVAQQVGGIMAPEEKPAEMREVQVRLRWADASCPHRLFLLPVDVCERDALQRDLQVDHGRCEGTRVLLEGRGHGLLHGAGARQHLGGDSAQVDEVTRCKTSNQSRLQLEWFWFIQIKTGPCGSVGSGPACRTQNFIHLFYFCHLLPFPSFCLLLCEDLHKQTNRKNKYLFFCVSWTQPGPSGHKALVTWKQQPAGQGVRRNSMLVDQRRQTSCKHKQSFILYLSKNNIKDTLSSRDVK